MDAFCKATVLALLLVVVVAGCSTNAEEEPTHSDDSGDNDLVRRPKRPDAIPHDAVDEDDAATERAIETATSFGNPKPTLTKPIKSADAPPLVRAKLEAARTELERRIRKTDESSSWFDGFYAIYDSPARTNISAYVARGFGSGEPDFEDCAIIGFNLKGKRVYYEIF